MEARPFAGGMLLLGLMGGAALLWLAATGEIPHWRWGGAVPAAEVKPLSRLGPGLAIAPGQDILCLGDSLTYGAARFGGTLDPINGGGSRRVATPYPETLQRLLGRGIHVRNRGFPADTVATGARRWRNEPSAAIVIVLYGTNDANPRGFWGRGIALERYRRQLAAMIRHWQRRGAQVLVLAPPPAGFAAGEAAIAPYRRAAHDIAGMTGASFIDPAEFMASVAVPIQIDGLHLKAEASAAIAKGLASVITLAEPGSMGTKVP